MVKTLDFEIIRKVKKLSHGLAQQSEVFLVPFSLTAAEGAVLEVLYPEAARTVPQIARRFGVSRQHIQVNVNSLKDKGLIYTRENPDHRRSPLLALTEAGRLKGAAINDYQKDLVADMFQGLTIEDKTITGKVLGRLIGALQTRGKI